MHPVEVRPVQYVEYTIQIPGVEGAIFLKLPAGSLPPRVVVSETVAAENAVVPIPPLRLVVPLPAPKKARHTIMVDGAPRDVPAAVARVLAAVVDGERELRLRPEVVDKLRLHLPELLARLHRDHDRKVRGNAALYRVIGVQAVAG